MPALPHTSFEASSVRRLSSKTSVLVKALALLAVKKLAPVNGPEPGPVPPIVARFAGEMPEPFGKLTPLKLIHVTGKGRKVSGSEMKSSRSEEHTSELHPHLNHRSRHLLSKK